MSQQIISIEQVEAAFQEIGKLAEEEYGLTLEALLKSDMAEERLRRLAGIILKTPFAKPMMPSSYNPTNARRSWHWDVDKFDDPRLVETGHYKLLKKLRDEVTNKRWDELRDISTHETGLMWVLGKWLKGKLAGDERSFQEYYYEPTTPEVNLVLNAANLLPIVSVISGVVGVPVLAVNLALIVTQFSYEKLTNPPEQPDS
ncbi:hypothetical protein [Photobacterium kasasachensis]|uniref:hypothetical protein n=1 Tax=Photobacterium kasasachensis TaxID=2910240 RepID=UPI003D11A982